MKYIFRKKFLNILIYGFITTIQKQTGITSIIRRGYDEHCILWDFDDVSLHEVIESLNNVKEEFKLGIIVIMSDKDTSYRAIAPLDIVNFKKLCKIIISTNNVDYLFFKWTVRRGYATIRMSDKKDRPKNKIVSLIGGYEGFNPDNIEKLREAANFVEYETDTG